MINSRSDYFKVTAGPAFKAIENMIYHLLKPFIKHVPVPDRPALIKALKRAARRYFQTDFVAFESHFTQEVMEAIELQVYDWCLSNYPELAKLIHDTLSGPNRMRTRTGQSATAKARRMSGDMCTSLGNGLSNLFLVLFLLELKGDHSYEGYVEGDDGLFSCQANLTEQDYAELGFTIKIEEIDDPCKGSFCGMVFSDAEEIIKPPAKFLSTFGWTSSFIDGSDRLMLELLRAKALSACYEAPQCPILGVLARHSLTLTRGVRPRFVDDHYHTPLSDEMAIPEFAPHQSTRELFAELYDLPIESQIAVERLIAMGRFKDSFPYLQHLIHPDMLLYSSNYVC
jgi:hypothetical protein